MAETARRWSFGSAGKILTNATSRLTASSYAAYGLNGVIVLFTARAMTSTDRGQYIAYTVWIAFSAAMSAFGIGPAIANRAAAGAATRRDIRTLPARALLHSVLGAACLTGGAFLAESLMRPDPGFLTIGIVGIWAYVVCDWVSYVMQGLGLFNLYAVMRVSPGAFVLLATSAAAILHSPIPPILAVAAFVVGAVLAAIVGYVGLLRSRDFSLLQTHWSGTYAFAIKAFVGSLALMVNLRLDVLFMSTVVVGTQLSAYSVAASIAAPLTAIGTAVGVRTYRALTTETGSARAKSLASGWRRVTLFAACLAIIAVVVAFFTPLIFGPSYQAAVAPAIVLIIGGVGLAATYYGTLASQALGKPGRSSVVLLGSAILGAVLLFSFVSPFGIMGAAIASLVSYWSGAVVLFVLTRGPK